jgi:myo-inositol 2-dehydrogenase / D-chiro-inositol 1-dehydrogenase
MEQVRIGIIGAGRIAHIMSDAYRQVPEARLVAVADVVGAASERLVAKCSIPVIYENYGDLLASDGVDAVLVCVPTDLHEEIVLAAAAAGKHIFCQKDGAHRRTMCKDD